MAPTPAAGTVRAIAARAGVNIGADSYGFGSLEQPRSKMPDNRDHFGGTFMRKRSALVICHSSDTF
jgi:AcrR family transcriptional regulator